MMIAKFHNAEAPNMECLVCEGQAQRVYRGLNGYQAPAAYDVVACVSCGVSYVLPMRSDSQVYDLIYRNAWRLPGYFEYATYASQVLREADPLTYLKGVSPVYQSISRYFESKTADRLKILELGSGMGYLTYALSRRGYDIVGVDISQRAVDRARQRYGDRFYCGDISRDFQDWMGHFDVVICTEVLEHVENPQGLLESIRLLLVDQGELVMTTPNRSAFPPDAVWESDTPPIHLWWFTPESMQILGKQAGYARVVCDTASDVDAGFLLNSARDYSHPKCTPVFDAVGHICFAGNKVFMLKLLLRNVARYLGVLAPIRRLKRKFSVGTQPTAGQKQLRPMNIVAILSR